MLAKSPPSSLQAWWAIWEFYSQHELRMPLKVGLEGWQPLWGLFLIFLFPAPPCPSAGDSCRSRGCRMGGRSSPLSARNSNGTWNNCWVGLIPLGCVWGRTAQLPPRGQDWDLWQRAGAATAKIHPPGTATALWEAPLVLHLPPDTRISQVSFW